MKKILLSLLVCGWFGLAFAQTNRYSTYHYQRQSLFEVLPVDSTSIVFLGNSITDGGELAELFQDTRVKNRGISSDVCTAVYDRLDVITKGKPNKVFLMIGVNDLGKGLSADYVVEHITRIIDKLKTDSPSTHIYVQSILPVNDTFGLFQGHTSRWAEIAPLNARLEKTAIDKGCTYVDLYTHFVLPEGHKLNPDYTNDGLHLMGTGYLKWAELVKPYIYDIKK